MEKNKQIADKRYAKQGWHILLFCLLGSILLSACTKQHVPGAASLTVFNGVTGSSVMVPNFSGNTPIIWYQRASKINYGGTSDPSPGWSPTITGLIRTAVIKELPSSNTRIRYHMINPFWICSLTFRWQA